MSLPTDTQPLQWLERQANVDIDKLQDNGRWLLIFTDQFGEEHNYLAASLSLCVATAMEACGDD